MSSDTNNPSIQRTYEDPVIPEFSIQILKIRRNLLIVGVISLLIIFFEITINPKHVEYLGLSFNGITERKINLLILLSSIYFFVYFLWLVSNFYQKNRLSVTSFIKKNRNSDLDIPAFNTLYNYCINQFTVKNIDEIYKLVNQINITLKDYSLNEEKITQALSNLFVISAELELIKSTYANPLLLENLESFRDFNYKFLLSQHRRWIILDVGLPIILGIVSIVIQMYLLIHN